MQLDLSLQLTPVTLLSVYIALSYVGGIFLARYVATMAWDDERMFFTLIVFLVSPISVPIYVVYVTTYYVCIGLYSLLTSGMNNV